MGTLIAITDPVYCLSVSDVEGRHWSCHDSLDNLGPWFMRTLQRIKEDERGYGYYPQITQFAKITR